MLITVHMSNAQERIHGRCQTLQISSKNSAAIFKKTNHFCDAHHFPHGHGASSKPMGIFTSKAVVHPKLVTLQDGEIRGTDPGMDQDLYGCW